MKACVLFKPALLAGTLALLSACGGDKPETLIASARDYLAKNDAKAAVIQLKNALQKAPDLAEARFLLGKALYESGDVKGAEIELRRAYDAKYAPDQVVPLLAQVVLATGDAKRVVELGEVSLSDPAAKADLLVTVGMAQATLRQTDKARASVDEALKLQPDDSRAALMKARILFSDQDIAGGLKVLDFLLEKDARNTEAWKAKGDVLAFEGKADEAMSAYRKALEAKPDYILAHAAIINLQLKAGKLDEAGTSVEAMKKVVPKHPQTLMAEAEYLYRKSDWQQALNKAQELLAIMPDSPKALLIAGATQFQLGQMAQAETNLARAVRLAPNVLALRRMLAQVYLRTGQPGAALTTVEPILDQIDADPVMLSTVGDIYMRNGEVEKAQEYFAKAATLDPKNPLRQTKVALAHLAEGKDSAFGELERIADADTGTAADMALIAAAIKRRDFAKAMQAIDRLDKKQANNPLVATLRGTVLVAKGDEAAARKAYEKALSIRADYFPAAAGLARLDVKDKKVDDARKRFQGVLATNPKIFQAELALGELEAKTGGSQDAVLGHIRKAVEADPTAPAPRVALIKFHLATKAPKEAVSAAQDAVSTMPNRPDLLELLARSQQAAGDTNRALATCGQLAGLVPNSPHPYLLMAEINVAAKNNNEAIQNLLKALEKKPDLLGAQRALIALYSSAQNYSEALAVTKEVKRQRPKEAAGYVFEGDIAALRKDWPTAAEAYQAGLRETASPELAVKFYSAMLASNKQAEAERFAATWLSDHPKDAAFRIALAEIAVARKEYPDAVRHYLKLVQTQPNNAALLNNLAWTFGQMNDPRALEYAEKANSISPNQPAIMETLGSILVQRGNATRGLDLLHKALELAPDSATLKLSLAKALIKVGKGSEAKPLLGELAQLGDKFPGHAEVEKLRQEMGN